MLGPTGSFLLALHRDSDEVWRLDARTGTAIPVACPDEFPLLEIRCRIVRQDLPAPADGGPPGSLYTVFDGQPWDCTPDPRCLELRDEDDDGLPERVEERSVLPEGAP